MALIIISLSVGTVVALVTTGQIQIGYRIIPSPPTAVTLTPSTISLNLTTILSGSYGTQDFGKVATLNLTSNYEIEFTLDITSADDFTDLRIDITAYKQGQYSNNWYLQKPFGNEQSRTVPAGNYDIHVKVTYTAYSFTSETTGTIRITASYPA